MRDFQKPQDYDYEATHKKVEDILMQRLDELFESIRSRDGNAFDEAADWIEYLLGYEQDTYEELIAFKEKLKRGLVIKLAEVYIESETIDNILNQKRYRTLNKNILEWQFRRDYLRKVVELFFKRQILVYRKTTYVKMEALDGIEDTTGRETITEADSQPQ